MKTPILTGLILVTLCLRGFAGTETVGDGKDMKETKQVAQVEQSDAGFYVAAYGGAQFITDYGDNHQTLSLGGSNVVSHAPIVSGWGGVGGIKFGYNFRSIDPFNIRIQPAVEAEALYIGDNSHADNIFVPGDVGRFSSNSGDFFLNGILRFKTGTIVTPYIGAGVGLQYITTHGDYTTPAGGVLGAAVLPGAHYTGLDTSDLDFAGQVLGGVDVAITDHFSLFSEYKWIDALGTDAKQGALPGGTVYRFKPDQIQQNLITAGIKYTF